MGNLIFRIFRFVDSAKDGVRGKNSIKNGLISKVRVVVKGLNYKKKKSLKLTSLRALVVKGDVKLHGRKE